MTVVLTQPNNKINKFLLFIKATCLLITFIFTPFTGFAETRLITDNRIENLNGFPSVGRGYNLQSNSLQSVCFQKITKTKPTFDLDYDIEEITEDFFKAIPESGKKRLGAANLHSFVRRYYKEQEEEQIRKYTLKNLLVKVEIRTYYYAIDETNSTLSESAQELLKKNQYVTFFNSCGHHYIRSVGNYSTYLALLQYKLSGDENEDRAFANRLERGIFNFSGGANTENNFNKDADARGMRVFVEAVGLSKGDMVNLVPVDIDQFRKTVQDAVKLMQDPNSGIVNYIEIAPWVENPELTAFITRETKNADEQFIKLQKLEANSGVITEINRNSNSQIEQFYVASMCQKNLFKNYVDKKNREFYENITYQTDKSDIVLYLTDIIDQKLFSYDMEKTLFYNLANENKKEVFISLREFIEYFAKNPPEKLFEENKKYLYGDKDNPGATDCINKLYDGGLDKIDFRKIQSCVNALKYIKSDTNFLDQYCLPKPAKLVFMEDESQQPQAERKKEDNTQSDKKDNWKKVTKEKPESLEDIGNKENNKNENIMEQKNKNKNKDTEQKYQTDKTDADQPKSLEDIKAE